MGALRDPKLEAFAQVLLSNLAAGLPRTKAAEEAARTAGYRGSSLGPNARKRAQRADVKARMEELAAPAREKAEAQVTATLEWATGKLTRIAAADLGEDAIKTPDQIAAIKLLAQIHGWLAPDKTEITGMPIIEIVRFSDVAKSEAAA